MGEEEYKKNWASRWMANIEARTEKLAAKKEEKKMKETSALGGGFRNFVSKVLPLRTWEKSTPTASTTTNNNVVESAASQPQQFQQQQKQLSRLSPRFRMDDQLATYPTT